jgi:hypothetical protein
MEELKVIEWNMADADPELPIFLATPSFSYESSEASTKVILENYQNIPNLYKKFRAIAIIMNYPKSFKERAKIAYDSSIVPRSDEDLHPEDVNYQILALEIISWMFSRGYKRIHLMGKCAGASLAQYIVQEGTPVINHGDKNNCILLKNGLQEIYIEELILVGPACRTPEKLLMYSSIPILCVWQEHDPKIFTWGAISEDPARYEIIFKNSPNVTLKTLSGNEHEIPSGLFELL